LAGKNQRYENDTNRLFNLRRQSIIKLAVTHMSIEEAARWADNLTVAGMERRICESEMWVAEIGEKVVGWGAIRDGQLVWLYTDPEFVVEVLELNCLVCSKR
jgi:putative acetyltransferase